MNVFEVSRVGVWAPHSRFRHVSSPFYLHTDYPWMHGAPMWETNEDVVCDYDLQAVYPAPLRVPCHVKLDTDGVPALNYYQQTWDLYTVPPASSSAVDYTAGYDSRLPQLEWQVLGDLPFSYKMGQYDLVQLQANYEGSGLPLYGRSPDAGQFVLAPHRGMDRDCSHWLYGQGVTYGANDLQHRFRASGLSLSGATFIQAPLWKSEIPTSRVVGPFNFNVSLPGGGLATVNGYQEQRHASPWTADRWYANRAVVGVGADAAEYEVRFQGGGDVEIRRRYQGEDWQLLQRVPPGGNPVTSASGGLSYSASFSLSNTDVLYTKANTVEFRLLCGRMAIRIGSTETPFYFEEARVGPDGRLIDRISSLEWAAERVDNFIWTCHPVRWRAGASIVSPEIPTGFRSMRIGEPTVHYAAPPPTGWTASVDPAASSLEGPTVTYELDFEGPADGIFRGQAFSNSVAAVRAVDLIWLPVTDYRPAPPAIVEPEAIEAAHEFSVDTLQIGSTGAIAFNANKPVALPTGEFGSWGQWMIAQGQTAVEVQLGRNVPASFLAPFGGIAGNTVLTGYGNVEQEVSGAPAPEGWQYVSRIADRRRQLMTDRWALPWMDGWNAFFAIAFLAQLGGVSLEEMTFIDYVPFAPFGPGTDLGSPEGYPAYYLPSGEQGSVLTRPSGVALWEVMSRIAFSIGYMIYFDLYGRLAFHKFFRPAGVKRSFYESDRESALAQAGGGLEGCWQVSVRKSMDQVRSDVILVGVSAFGPTYRPIVYKRSDDGVVYDDLAFNHLGYRSPSAVIDSLYADERFAYDASNALITCLRLPDLAVGLTTWLQPDIFPMDVFRLQSDRAGTTGIPFMVTGVRHSLTKDSGSTRIRGQFVPEGLF